jgi:hypothetical protein
MRKSSFMNRHGEYNDYVKGKQCSFRGGISNRGLYAANAFHMFFIARHACVKLLIIPLLCQSVSFARYVTFFR